MHAGGCFDPAPVLALQGDRSDVVFAAVLGVSRATVVRWRTGRHRLYRKQAELVAAALGMDPGVLWPDPDEPLDPDWERRALCQGASITFFGDDSAAVKLACDFCASCPVRRACGEHALTNGIDHGVWGGMSARERRRILKQRRLAARASKVA